MSKPVSHIQNGQQLWLSSDRCIFWEEKKALLVSDLHFGKTGHFRREGIAVPQHVFKEDLQRLIHQIQFFQPDNLIVVGDMFHSRLNLELELFRKWRKDFPNLSIELIKGNHDILQEDWYRGSELTVHADHLSLEPFRFTHDIASLPDINDHASFYHFSGHIHPGILVHGGGKQSLRFPCFYFGKEYAVLPAFSRFTGTYLIEPKAKESVFAIVENKIVQFQ